MRAKSLKKSTGAIGLLVCLCLLAAVIFPPAASASGVSVYLNGVPLSFDQPPLILNDRTMVPLRGIFEALGCDVYFIQEDQLIVAVKDETKLFLKIGSSDLLKLTIPAGETLGDLTDLTPAMMQETQLDVPPQIVNDRTLVPARAISDALGIGVEWDGALAAVNLTCTSDFLAHNTDTAFYSAFSQAYYGSAAHGEILFSDEDGTVYLTRSDIVSAAVKQSPGADSYYIELTLTEQGRQNLASATSSIASRQDGRNRMVITVDGITIFTPRITGQIQTSVFDLGGILPHLIAQQVADRINVG